MTEILQWRCKMNLLEATSASEYFGVSSKSVNTGLLKINFITVYFSLIRSVLTFKIHGWSFFYHITLVNLNF